MDLRAPFPYLRERVYLDTAAAGLCWQGHGAAVARFHDEVKNRGIDARPEWQAMTQKVRGRLADWLSVAADDITFLSNTTEGLNLAAHSLRLQPGDRIVMAADEFPSLVHAFAGADVLAVPVPREEDRESTLLAALEAPGARVLVVSHTHWSTGTTLDLARLGRHCRERGVLLMVDGIQALGAIPVDLSLVDIYAASFFKWMLSGFGIGVLITSARARASMTPAYRGYANADDAGQLQYAHVNLPAIYGLDATIDFFAGIGWDRVFERVQVLGTHLILTARQLGLELITPEHQRAGLFMIRCADAGSVREQLAAQNISVSARGEGIRLSPHYYNTTDDVDQGLNALARLTVRS